MESSAEDTDDRILELAANVAKSLPDLYDLNAATEKYPKIYEQSMNTVLRQVQLN